MADLSRDPIVNVVHGGIKRDIRLLLDQDALRGALLLTLAGIDTMGYLAMEDRQENPTRRSFVAWADRYVRFACAETITAMELYAARCAALHNYGTESSLSRTGKCRQILWMSEAQPEIRYNAMKQPGFVVVSIPALAQAFFDGIDRFLVDTYSDPKRKERAEARFKKIMHSLPGPGAGAA